MPPAVLLLSLFYYFLRMLVSSLVVDSAVDHFGFFLSQGYHMGVVMEERCTREVSDRDAAIETLKVEIERLEGEKGSLSDSLTALRLSLAKKE